jgi:hypothetical protein
MVLEASQLPPLKAARSSIPPFEDKDRDEP